MISELQLKTLVGLVIVVLAVVLLVEGEAVPAAILFSAFSYAVTAVSIALVLWDMFLWHWWPFQPYLHTKPDLRGTWRGELVSDYRDTETGQQKPPIAIYIVVRQTFSTLDVRLLSPESSSVSLSASLYADNVGLYSLASTYRNTPTVLRRSRSPISHGGLLLAVRGAPVHQLDGEYWTDRSTKGELVLSAHSKNIAHDYVHAARLKYTVLAKV